MSRDEERAEGILARVNACRHRPPPIESRDAGVRLCSKGFDFVVALDTNPCSGLRTSSGAAVHREKRVAPAPQTIRSKQTTIGPEPLRRSARPQLDPRVIAGFRRRRIVDALAELCAEMGYRNTSVAEIAQRASTSRNTIYEHFPNREAIFLAVFATAEGELFERCESACAAAAAESRLEAGLAALLDWIAERPDFAAAVLVEALCAGPEAMWRYMATVSRATDLLAPVIPGEVERPRATEESLVGGAMVMLSALVRAGEAERAPTLLADLLKFLDAPFREVPAPGRSRYAEAEKG